VDTETGELGEPRLAHREEAEQFYGELRERSLRVRVGMEASGHARWFERWLLALQFELWIGHAAEIRTKRVRKQKTDRQDAQLLLRLMIEDRFPRIDTADIVRDGDVPPVMDVEHDCRAATARMIRITRWRDLHH
jgi:transposase